MPAPILVRLPPPFGPSWIVLERVTFAPAAVPGSIERLPLTLMLPLSVPVVVVLPSVRVLAPPVKVMASACGPLPESPTPPVIVPVLVMTRLGPTMPAPALALAPPVPPMIMPSLVIVSPFGASRPIPPLPPLLPPVPPVMVPVAALSKVVDGTEPLKMTPSPPPPPSPPPAAPAPPVPPLPPEMLPALVLGDPAPVTIAP